MNLGGGSWRSLTLYTGGGYAGDATDSDESGDAVLVGCDGNGTAGANEKGSVMSKSLNRGACDDDEAMLKNLYSTTLKEAKRIVVHAGEVELE